MQARINDQSHMPTRDTVRIAAVSDVHYGKQSQGMLQSLFSQIAERADVLLMPGDLTDYGLAEEARVLARDLTASVKTAVPGVRESALRISCQFPRHVSDLRACLLHAGGEASADQDDHRDEDRGAGSVCYGALQWSVDGFMAGVSAAPLPSRNRPYFRRTGRSSWYRVIMPYGRHPMRSAHPRAAAFSA